MRLIFLLFTLIIFVSAVADTRKHLKVDSLVIGNPSTSSNRVIEVSGTTMKIRANVSSGIWEITNDGTSWSSIDKDTKYFPSQILTISSGTCPPGTIEANGQAVSRTSEAGLFSKIGTTYGTGDGSTTFNVPNYKGAFLRGWSTDSTVDPSGPRSVGSYQEDEFKAHNHNYLKPYLLGNAVRGSSINVPWFSANTTESRGGAETRPKNFAVKHCIAL